MLLELHTYSKNKLYIYHYIKKKRFRLGYLPQKRIPTFD